ncbi:hypothetical protein F4821DRAFT_250920 [Hypoxylon rubiginosum]|uniref:Uncharacterized protein n=1 Tax=Hypoxylon rubiginosum TaxID=110542 RepID=A0ACC0CJW4_9PEZI|nr:hypothetical protein F4821DRAFT_250920 [Hypoxylon rubiginosum]
MAFDQPTDAIPLLMIESSHGSDISDIAHGPGSYTAENDDDGAAPLQIFGSDEYKLLLKMPPVCTPIRLEWHQSVVKLTPAAFLVIPLGAIIAHEVLVTKFKNDLSSQIAWGPAIIVTAMVLPIVWLYLYHTDREYQQDTNRELEYITIIPTLIILCILAPMLSIPIFDSSTFASSETYLSTSTYASLLSWSQAIPNLAGSLPLRLDQTTRRPPNPWLVEDFSVKSSMKDSITFPRVRNSRGGWSKVRNDDQESDRHGLYMPILAPTRPEPLPDTAVETGLKVMTQALSVSLECQFMDIDSYEPPSLQSTGKPSLAIRVRDKDSCISTVNMTGVQLDETSRHRLRDKVLELSSTFSSQSSESQRFIQDHLIIFGGQTDVTAFAPAWSRLSPINSPADDEYCRQRLAIVGLSRPFQVNDSEPRPSLYQMASCKPQFWVADQMLEFRRRNKLPFHGLTNYTLKGAYLGNIRHQLDLPLKWKWENLAAENSTHLSEAFLSDTAAFPAVGTEWPYHLLNNEAADVGRIKPIGSLLLSSQLLLQSFVAHLSTAAEVTLREQLASDRGHVQIRTGDERMKRSINGKIFQHSFMFQASKWLWVIILARFVCSWYAMVWHLDFMNYTVPWSLSSPAARALLLQHSSIRPWLRALHTARCRLKDLPSLRIGYWHVHPKAGQEGWRLDTEDNYCVVPNKVDTTENTEKSLTVDFVAELNCLLCGIYAGIAIVIYIITETYAMVVASRDEWKGLPDASMWHVLMGMNREKGFLNIFTLRMLPTSLVFYCTLFWLPSYYYFICRRQPWKALLHKAQPASASITLDYSTKWFPLYYSIRNRQWLISILAIANLGSIFVPAFQVHLNRVSEVIKRVEEPVFRPRVLEWAENINSSLEIDQSVFDHALRGLIDRLDPDRMWLPSWAPAEVALPPFKSSGPGDFAYNASALRASLECEEVPIDIAMQPRSPDGTSSRVQYLSIPQEDNDSSSVQVRIPTPCTALPPTLTETEQDPSFESTSHEVICARWWLDHSSSYQQNDPDRSRWIITIVRGNASWSSQNREMRFWGTPSAIATTCHSKLVKESARISITDRLVSGEYNPIKYEPLGRVSKIDDGLVAAINRGLNHSNTRFDAFDDGIVAPEALIHTNHFVGDYLSWTLYQHIYAACPDCLTAEALGRDASFLFGAYLSALTWEPGAGFLKSPDADSEMLKLQPLVYQAITKVSRSSLVYQTVFTLLCICLLLTIPSTYKRYYMTPSPEPLLNSLVLFSMVDEEDDAGKKWDIPSRLEKEDLPIRGRQPSRYWRQGKYKLHKEHMKPDIRELYRRIEGWKLNFGFAYLDTELDSTRRVVVALPAPEDEGETEERYHDNVASEGQEELGRIQRRRTWETESS